MSVGVGPWIDPSVLIDRSDRRVARRARHTRAWTLGVGVSIGVLLSLAMIAGRDGALALLAAF